MPVISVVGIAMLFIAVVALAFSMKPMPVVWEFLIVSSAELFPLTMSLLEIWLAYAVLYFIIIVYSRWRELILTARVVCEATIPAILAVVRYLIHIRFTSHVRIVPRLNDGLRNLVHTGLPDHLSLGFRDGIQPKLE